MAPTSSKTCKGKAQCTPNQNKRAHCKPQSNLTEAGCAMDTCGAGQSSQQRKCERVASCKGGASSYQSQTKAKTLIFITWDDVLFPSSHLKVRLGLDCVFTDFPSLCPPKKYLERFEHFESIILLFMNEAMKLGTVQIMSHGGSEWVHASSKKLLPQLHKFVKDSKIEISKHEVCGREKVYSKVVRSFLGCLEAVPKNLNLVSIGWSKRDTIAVHSLKGTVDKDCMKIITLVPAPALDDLIFKLKRLGSILRQYVDHDGFIVGEFREE